MSRLPGYACHTTCSSLPYAIYPSVVGRLYYFGPLAAAYVAGHGADVDLEQGSVTLAANMVEALIFQYDPGRPPPELPLIILPGQSCRIAMPAVPPLPSTSTDAVLQRYILGQEIPKARETHCFADKKPYMHGVGRASVKGIPEQGVMAIWREHLQEMMLWNPGLVRGGHSTYSVQVITCNFAVAIPCLFSLPRLHSFCLLSPVSEHSNPTGLYLHCPRCHAPHPCGWPAPFRGIFVFRYSIHL